MDRARFDGRSVAVVDICTMHGLWLDAGETVTVLNYIRERLNDGGTVPETAAEKKEEAVFEQNMARIDAYQPSESTWDKDKSTPWSCKIHTACAIPASNS